MAYTVHSSFDQFYEAINLAGDHRSTANSRRDALVSLLERHFEVVESFSSGSIPRFTALKSKADLDVIVALHYGKHIKDKTPTQVLQSVRDALGTYRNQVRKNGQAVTLYYQTWPAVDIVPVSRAVDSQGNVTHYNVPNSKDDTWIQSNPKAHADDIDNRAAKCGPNFRRAIKMIKAWNSSHSSYLQSYHIEVMALHTFDSEMNDFTWDLLQFFKRSRELIASSLWHGRGYADAYLTANDREEIKKRLSTAEEKARMGWYYNTEGNAEESIKYWKQLFGDSFPAYG
jgi:hypothetical protein